MRSKDLKSPVERKAWSGKAAGRALARLREEAKLDQKTTAQRAGLSAGLISLIEKGERSPSVETKEKLADAIGCDRQEFAVMLVEAGYSCEFSVEFKQRLKALLKSTQEPS